MINQESNCIELGKIKLYIQLFLSAAIIFLLYRTFIDDFSQIKVHMDPLDLSVIIVLGFISIVPRVYRWIVLMKHGEQGVNITFWASFKITLVGLALNIVSPGGSGDILKSYYGYQWTGIKERMVAVSLYDKLIAVLSLAVIGIVGWVMTLSMNYLLASAACACIFIGLTNAKIVSGVFKIGLVRKINEKTLKLDPNQLVTGLRYPFSVVMLTISLSLLAWLIDFVILYYCLVWSGVLIELQEVIFDGSVLKLGKLFPFTLNGMGTDELIMGYLFASEEAEIALVLVGSVIYRFTIDIVPALVGVVFMILGKRK